MDKHNEWFATLQRWFQIPAWLGFAGFLWRLASEADTALSIWNRFYPSNGPPPRWLVNFIASPWAPLVFAAVWFTVVAWLANRKPARRRTVELYPDADKMHSDYRGLSKEGNEEEELWVAFESGQHFEADLTDGQRRKIKRMVLLAPGSDQVGYFARMSEIPADDIDTVIRRSVKLANRLGIEVRFSHAPLLNCVLARHNKRHWLFWRREETKWVRVQIFIPHRRAPHYPNLVVHARRDSQTVQNFTDAYENMWQFATPPEPDIEVDDRPPSV